MWSCFIQWPPTILIVLAPEPTRTSAIHKEKLNVPLRGYEHNAKSKCLGEKPEVTIAILCSFIVLRNTNSFFAGTIKNKHKFKISLGQFTIYSLAFVEVWLLNVFFWERKTGFGIAMKNCAGCEILVKKERESGKRTPSPSPLPDPPLSYYSSLRMENEEPQSWFLQCSKIINDYSMSARWIWDDR